MAQDRACLDQLLGIIFDLTLERGDRKALAEFLGTAPQNLNAWFAGRFKPNGEMTLQLLSWVVMQKLERNSDLDDILRLLVQVPHRDKSDHGRADKKLQINSRAKTGAAANSRKNRMYSEKSKAILDKRRRKIVEMREQGIRFSQIGDAVGVTGAYAQILHADAVKRMNRVSDDVFGLLSPRARNCLKREGFQTKNQVIDAIQNGSLHPARQGQYGPKTHAEICRWADVSEI